MLNPNFIKKYSILKVCKSLNLFSFYFLHSLAIYAECNYLPNQNEGYLQLWNMEALSENYNLFLTFIVSNLGNGKLNNGVTIYLYDKLNSKEYLKTLEFTNKHLKAKENLFYIALENENHLILENNDLLIQVNSGNDNFFKINTKLKIQMQTSNHIISKIHYEDQSIFFKILYIIPQDINFFLNDKQIKVFSSVGVECILSTDDPLNLAKSFYFLRNFDLQNPFFMLLVEPYKQIDQDINIIYIKNGHFFLNLRKSILKKNNTFIFDFYDCSVSLDNLLFLGGFDVFHNVSFILRWFLRLVGINPYIKHYKAYLSTNCIPDLLQDSDLQFTHIQLRN